MNDEQIIIPDDRQPIGVEVTVHGTNVVQHFTRPVEFAPFDGAGAMAIGARLMHRACEARPDLGQAAIDLSMAMVDLVYEIRGDLKPAGGSMKQELIDRHRRVLTTRIEHILKTKREQKTVNHSSLSRLLVDAMCNEIFT